MPLEYELKYVLHNNNLENKLEELALKKPKYSWVLIEQHYLSSPARIRKITTLIKNGKVNHSIEYVFGYKPKINGSVIEIEKQIDEDDFRLLLPETKRNLLKIRFQEEKPSKNEHWIVDFFKSRGDIYFVQAECELYGKIKKPKRMPDYILENLALEVDHNDSRFSSRSLCDVTKSTELYEKIVRGENVKKADA